MDFTKVVDELHVEYVKNGYPKMWMNKEEKGAEIGALFSCQWEVARISAVMEQIRSGDIPEGILKRDKTMIQTLSEHNFAKISHIAELLLIVTEVNEAINAILCGEDPSKEHADIAIRNSNCHKRNSDRNLEEVILEKHAENLARGALHGRKI